MASYAVYCFIAGCLNRANFIGLQNGRIVPIRNRNKTVSTDTCFFEGRMTNYPYMMTHIVTGFSIHRNTVFSVLIRN